MPEPVGSPTLDTCQPFEPQPIGSPTLDTCQPSSSHSHFELKEKRTPLHVSGVRPVTPQKACGHVHARGDPPRSHGPCDHQPGAYILYPEIGRTPVPFPLRTRQLAPACHSSPSLVLAVGSHAATLGGRHPRSTECTKALEPRNVLATGAAGRPRRATDRREHSHTAVVWPVTQRVACKPGDLELSEDALAGRRNGSARQFLLGRRPLHGDLPKGASLSCATRDRSGPNCSIAHAARTASTENLTGTFFG
jgi:hypothetical protein